MSTRKSFWKLFGEHALRPLFAGPVRRAEQRVPSFVAGGFAGRTDFAARLPSLPPRGPLGRAAAEALASARAVSGFMERGALDDGVERRHPFLHRPLVELALGLPPELLMRGGVAKRVVREAMRGILPEEVRTRTGHLGPGARMDWSLTREAALLERLLRRPVSAELGWVDAGRLRAAVERVRAGASTERSAVYTALALETWLAVRTGRWEAVALSHHIAA